MDTSIRPALNHLASLASCAQPIFAAELVDASSYYPIHGVFHSSPPTTTSQLTSTLPVADTKEEEEEGVDAARCGKRIVGRHVSSETYWTLMNSTNAQHHSECNEPSQECIVAFVGDPNSPLLLGLAMKFNTCAFLLYDPSSSHPRFFFLRLSVRSN